MSTEKGEGEKLKRFYKNKKWRWILYVVLPGVILLTFISFLMCIQRSNHQMPAPLWLQYANEWFEEEFPEDSLKFFKGFTPQCTPLSADQCFLLCKGDINSQLSTELEAHQHNCNGSLKLELLSCLFRNNTITSELFHGNFKISTLVIKRCSLMWIVGESFAVPAFENLTEISFEYNFIDDLYSTTFSGLNALKKFKFINYDIGNSKLGYNFLAPMQLTLTEAHIQQITFETVYYAGNWFMGKFEQLTQVFLNDNRFSELNEYTFTGLAAVQNLSLRNCHIHYVNKKTFNGIGRTLHALDLRDNKLITLDVGFLQYVIVPQFVLELSGNKWNCTCDNEEMISSIKEEVFYFTDLPKCTTPLELASVSMDIIELNCDIQPTETTGPTITTTETTTKPITETSTSNSPTPTPSPPPTSATSTSTSTFTTSTTSASTPSPGHSDYVFIQCKLPPNLPYFLTAYNPERFAVESLSATSVSVTRRTYAEDLKLLIFNIHFSRLSHFNESNYAIVNNLKPFESYVFCFTNTESRKISPLNCSSHLLAIPMESQGWIFQENKTLFLLLGGLGIFLLIIVGSGSTYFLLRWRPIWLRGSKRIERISPKTPKVYLYREDKKINGNKKSSNREKISSKKSRVNSDDSTLSCTYSRGSRRFTANSEQCPHYEVIY